MQNILDSQNVLKNVLAVAPKHCDNCGSKYSESDFRVMKSSTTNVILHLRCRACNNVYMLNIMNPVNGMVGAQRIPLNIDLNDNEINRFANSDAVSEDDALDLFDKIETNSNKETISKLLRN